MQVKVHVKEDMKPKFYKPRNVPFLIRERLENELERLQRENIIVPVQFSEWAAPVVPVVNVMEVLEFVGIINSL